MTRTNTRRDFVAISAAAIGGAALPRWAFAARWAAPTARLASRPGKPTRFLKPGTQRLGLAPGPRDANLYVPESYNASASTALMLSLHGATQAGELMTTRLAPLADALKCPVLAPDSRSTTWDGIRGDFDQDVAFIDKALAWVFDHAAVDPKRIWLSGFSDGASYGLSLGLANGDLFPRVLAFSPGFMPPASRSGAKPRVFVSHGTADQILPIDRCSRVIVPQLKADGYDVRFDEFDGGHRMPPEIVSAATEWLKK